LKTKFSIDTGVQLQAMLSVLQIFEKNNHLTFFVRVSSDEETFFALAFFKKS